MTARPTEEEWLAEIRSQARAVSDTARSIITTNRLPTHRLPTDADRAQALWAAEDAFVALHESTRPALRARMVGGAAGHLMRLLLGEA